MISRSDLEEFARTSEQRNEPPSPASGFDMDGYLRLHGFAVLRRKPWNSNPGGLIFELEVCPFDTTHGRGSAAFTLVGGVPGFSCKHNGCSGKFIKDVFALFPPEPANAQNESSSAAERDHTQAQLLCELAEKAQLFHTADGDGYAQVPVNGHIETWPIRSRGFRSWLRLEFYRIENKPPGSQPFQDALNLLEARAQHEGPEMPVFVRVAGDDNTIYIDLCNSKWDAVEITPSGWRVVPNPPVRFRRSKGMLPLPYPAKNGLLSLLRDLINIGDDSNWIMCISWLIAAARPRGPYPILILHGEQGSAKSTTEKLLRRLIDPSASPMRTPPRSERDLAISASNAWVLAFDNLSGMPAWLSDGLCRVATGGGMATRQLYTDSEEALFDAMRPMMLNGIDHIADRPDLAERALILYLPTIRESDRREEAELYADFDQKLPAMFGGLCDALTTALAMLPSAELPNKPRMADFARFATAAMPALGFPREAFLDAYSGNRADAVRDTIEGDPVAVEIMALLDAREERGEDEPWIGSCKDLLRALESQIDDIAKRSEDWPKTPRGLSGHLRRLVTFLRQSGVDVSFAQRAKGKRPVTIKRIGLLTTVTNVTTTAHDEKHSAGQSDSTNRQDGCFEGAATAQPSPGDKPSTNAADGTRSPARGCESGNTVVPEVTVVCSAIPKDQVLRSASTRTDVCPSCGPTDWQWLNGKWVCPRCGAPAPGQPGKSERERFEL